MQISFSPYMLLPLFSMLMALLLVNRTWRHRNDPLGKTFLLLMLALAWWSLAVVLEHLSIDLAAKTFWMKMSYLGITSIPIGWLVFILKYTDRAKWLSRRNMAILTILPVITLMVVWTDGIHHLMWKDIWLDTSLSPPVDAVTHGTWFWVYATYAYSLLALGTVYLAVLFRKSSGIYRRQAGVLLTASLIPWAGNLLFISGVGPFTVIDPTPLAFAVTGIAFYWGMSRLMLLDIMPIAHEVVLRSIGDGVVVIDARGRVIELNPAAQNMIGRQRTDVIGQPYDKALPGQMAWLDLNTSLAEEQALVPVGEGANQHYYEVSISPLGGSQRFRGHVLLLHDGTGRIKAEADSRERIMLETELSERRTAAEVIQRRLDFEEAVARISSRFVIVSAIDKPIVDSLADVGELNGASRVYLFLLSEDGATISNTHEWCARDVKSQTSNLQDLQSAAFSWWMSKLGNKETIRITDVSRMPDEAAAEKGMLESLDIKSALALPISVVGELAGFIGVDNTRDIRDWDENDVAILKVSSEIIGSALERKRASDQLGRLNEELRSLNLGLESKVEERTEQLQEAVADAKASSQAKSDFLASMSHELRTPLNAIIGFSQVLHEQYFGSLNEKQSEYVADIVESGKHLLSLINDILDLSKIEAGKMELEVSPVKIVSLVQGSLVMIKEKAMAHGINLEVQTAEELQALEITGDERRLKQVMFNLLSNAIKFTPDGGTIRIEAGRDDMELTVSVSDSGIGMTPPELKKLFQAFYQASGGIKDKTPGTGLGLAITRSIVEKHGGRIRVESEGLNKGSIFTFTLPIRVQDPDGSKPGSALPTEFGRIADRALS
jgi:PAS domain S-box-containing protein